MKNLLLAIITFLSLGVYAQDTQVSVFNYDGLNGSPGATDCGVENANLIGIINAISGYTVDGSIDSFANSGTLATQLDASTFFFMTDMESQDPNNTTFFPVASRGVIESWVNTGGVMVMTGTSGPRDVDFLNLIFSWDLGNVSSSSWAKNTSNTAGTPFDTVTATSLPSLSATNAISKGTVANFTSMWGVDSNAVVAVIEYGSGYVIYMGYDFFNTGPGCPQYSSDWVQQIIPAALDYASALSSSAVTNITEDSGDFEYTFSESGTTSYILVAGGSTAPTAAQVAAGVDYSGVTVIDNATVATTADVAHTFNLTGLTPNTNYDVYAVTLYFDGFSNVYSAVENANFTTLPNEVPVGSAIADQSECINASLSGLSLTITDTYPGDNTFIVTATSSNTSVVANGDITITGTGNTRSIAITPVLDASGTSTITVSMEDSLGAVGQQTFDVTFIDNTLPTLTSVVDRNENVDASCNFTLPDYTSLTTATDDCGTATVTQSPAIGTVISGHATVQTITLTADDGNGNTNNTTFDVTLVDATLPALTSVVDRNENVDASCNFTLPDYTSLTTATDNCGTATVTQSPAIGTVISGHATVQTITLTVDDGNGNTNNTTFDVTLVDATLPALTSVVDRNENADASCNFTLPDYTSLTTATDNCGTATVTQSPAIGTIISGHATVQTITLTVDDGNGNTNNTTFDVTLVDATLPALTSVVDRNENVDASCNFTLPDYTSLTTATDNCGTATVTQSPAIGTVISGHATVQTITLTADDGNGNTNNTTFDVTLVDATLPALTSVVDRNENVDASCNFTLPDYTSLTTATDNCGTATVTQSPAIGTVISGHATVQTITLTVDDGNGNTNNTTFDVTLVDATLPALTSVVDRNENVDASCNFTLPDYTSLTTATDNCGTATVTQSPAIGTVISGHATVQTITLTVDDGNGNTNNTTFDVTLVDATLPALTSVVDRNENVDASCNFTLPDYTSLTTATDNCGTATVTQSPAIGTVISGHATVQTITLTADDGNGNTNNTTFDVTLVDATLPALTSVVDRNENVDASCNFTLPDYTSLTTATDNCGTATVTQSPAIGTVISGHATVQTITLTVDDGNGNTNNTTFDVTLVDATLPALTSVVDRNENVDASCNFTLPDYTSLTTATDNCGTATVTQSPAIGTVISGHATVQTITLTVDDGNGNTNNTTFDVTLVDVTPPTLTAVASRAEDLDADCNFTIPDYTGLTTATDNCGTATVTQSPAIGTVISGHVTVQTITLTADDGNGNTNDTTFDIILVDVTLPALTVVADRNENLDADCNFTIPDYTGLTTVTDNCGAATVTQSPVIGTVISGHATVQTITLTADDGNGNANSTTFDVTLVDVTSPIAVAQNMMVQLDAFGAASITPAEINNGSTDTCGIADISLDITTFSCDDVGDNTVTLTVTDVNGNSDSVTAIVTVEDQVNPTVLTQNLTAELDSDGLVTITAAQIDNLSTDNCAIATYVVDKTNFDCSNLGLNTVTLTVTDVNGNSDSATAEVTVVDQIAPIAIAVSPFTVQLDEIGSALYMTAEDIDGGSTDNCAIASMTIDKDMFTCDDLGENTVTLTVTDTSGNSHTATTTITVEDTVDPIVVTQDLTITMDETGEARVTAAEFIDESFDNCSISTISIDRTDFDCVDLGDYIVTLTVTDSSDNTTIEEAILTITGTDTDGDLMADPCDPDDDNDGVPDSNDFFSKTVSPSLVPAEAFTPNGDGINDSWMIPGINNYPNSIVKVYNRWGHEVYATKGYQNDWNGVYKSNSEKVPSGSYLYVIDLGNGSALLRGWIFINY